MMTLIKNIMAFSCNFKTETQGSVMPMVAIVIGVVCGAAALAVDLSYGYQAKSQLLTIAESSALAGATALPNKIQAQVLVARYAEYNEPGSVFSNSVDPANVKFGYWDNVGKQFVEDDKTITAIQVTAKSDKVQTFFAKIFGIDTLKPSATSVVTGTPGQPVCIAALDPWGSQALELNSDATIDVKGCEVFVNSTSNSALYTDSNATVIDAERVCVKGNTQSFSNSTINPTPDNGCSGPSDPFADVVAPDYSGCDYVDASYDSVSTTLMPGVYCGGLEIKGNSNISFTTGDYIIKDNRFFVDSNSSISGAGVGFFLTGNGAVINFNSNSTIDLSAQSSGSMAGLIFFQDRNYGGTHLWDSNNVSNLSGAIYLPAGDLEFNSNTAIATPSTCTQIIAYRIRFDSNSGLTLNADFSKCPGGDRGSTSGGTVVLRK